ncbi:MAG: glycosyl hydrolase [Pseudomonadaceae bacterium]|nr:MAG: glycosyl hydrolase [Pseudomonadaceae bacterium]
MFQVPLRPSRSTYLRPLLLTLAFSPWLLTGCEAPLNLQAVEQQRQQSLQRTDFFQAMAANQQLTVLAGNAGVLLRSADNGGSWQRLQLPTEASLIDLDLCPDQSFIALSFDNRIWHGSADASEWTAYPLPSSEQMMTAACAPDGSWWAAGGFSTWQVSDDQGANWQEDSLYEDAILTNLQFIDEDQAVMLGEFGMLFTSDDGGQSWEPAGSLPDEFYPHASHFNSLDQGWVGGLNGFIYYTRDGGESWQRQTTPTEVPIFGFINDAQGLFALGDNATVLGLEGQQWQMLPTPDQPLYLRTGRMLPNQQLLVAGGRGLVLSVDLPKALAASTD